MTILRIKKVKPASGNPATVRERPGLSQHDCVIKRIYSGQTKADTLQEK